MDELVAKLTNLSYEFFGVILPGLVGGVLLLLWWLALGPVATNWSWGLVPQLSLSVSQQLVNALNTDFGVGLVFPALVAAYFLGHTLHWLARSGPSAESGKEVAPRARFFGSLLFRIPKPGYFFSPKLEGMFKAVQGRLSEGNIALEWRQFFPIAKCYLAQNLPTSLVATYQNKYTLHRSVTTAAAAWFWLNIGGIAGGTITACLWSIHPRWGLLVTFAIGALALVWGFSGSYLLHWEMFGNSIVTETYSLCFGPKSDRSAE